MLDFKQTLQWGQMGETAIAYWLRNKGYTILPAYDVPMDNGKGPRLYMASASGHNQLVAPDMIAMNDNGVRWIEAKRKTHFGWYRNFAAWQTGIDKRHYEHYLHVREITKLPVWIMFLHESPIPSPSDLAQGSPRECPTGLFGQEILTLKQCISQDGGYWKNGRYCSMVYWKEQKLIRLATLEEVLAAQPVISHSEEDIFDCTISF